MAEYKAQLLAVHAKLAKDPENEELISLKADLEELIELSTGLEKEEEEEQLQRQQQQLYKHHHHHHQEDQQTINPNNHNRNQELSQRQKEAEEVLKAEAELIDRKKEKNRKKKAKLREKIQEQLSIAESEKQSWQSFANKKGLKGVTKKSIFASPYSLTAKVGVGTNGIADASSASRATAAALVKGIESECGGGGEGSGLISNPHKLPGSAATGAKSSSSVAARAATSSDQRHQQRQQQLASSSTNRHHHTRTRH